MGGRDVMITEEEMEKSWRLWTKAGNSLEYGLKYALDLQIAACQHLVKWRKVVPSSIYTSKLVPIATKILCTDSLGTEATAGR